MTGQWQRGISLANAKDIATAAATASGTAVTSTVIYTKGPWSQLIASTTTSTSWMLICAESVGLSGGFACAFDIGIGASGSEVVIVPNFINNIKAVSYVDSVAQVLIPLKIKAGTRIAARGSSEVTTFQAYVQVILFGDAYGSCGSSGSVTTYGFSTSSNIGLSVDGGTTPNTKGTYVEISPSLTYNIAGFFLGFDTQDSIAGSTLSVPHLIDIAVGGSGSEVVILPDYQQTLYWYNTYQSGSVGTIMTPFFPIPIEAGTRVAVRTQNPASTTPDSTIGVTFYGVRQ